MELIHWLLVAVVVTLAATPIAVGVALWTDRNHPAPLIVATAGLLATLVLAVLIQAPAN